MKSDSCFLMLAEKLLCVVMTPLMNKERTLIGWYDKTKTLLSRSGCILKANKNWNRLLVYPSVAGTKMARNSLKNLSSQVDEGEL